MAGARGLSRGGYEEKGKRATRSMDAYRHKEGMKEEVVCTGCRAFFMNKRWHSGGAATGMGSGAVKGGALCPACQRMQDGNPAGIATFSGEYLRKHEAEILNTIKNVEEKARVKNPLARIMAIDHEGGGVAVSTTDDKLAQKLGKDIYKAYSGRLEYQWSKEDSFVRVNWSR
jgi:hypothetical protein